ncbi:MAG: phosphate regulon sensor histidine kinase PhoR [Rhodocyclales bacterium]|nr:phosphate regulon sensor histidine kinase PhoR [Rhodocyclales bacterium]
MTDILLWIAASVAAVLAAVVLRDGLQLRRLIRWARQPIGTPVPDGGGRWGDAYAALHKRARAAAEQREQLHEALERFRQAAEAMPDGVVILGAQLSIEWANSQAEHQLGIDNGRDVGAPVINIVREPQFVAYLQGGDYATPCLLRSVRRAGLSLQVRAVPFGQGRLMLLVRDVTQLERLETMRRDFVANVSHELKTPLTVVSGFIDTLADGWADLSPEDTRHMLALAGEQAARMQRLIEDLLTLSALETDAPPQEEQISMAAVLADVREEAEVLSAGRHEILLVDSGPPGLLGNPRELRSAFGNLASNAVRYTPAGGRIEMLWQRESNGDATFTVADNGIGIEAQHIARLTERFYRVDRGRSRETGGTGLGLAIVKHVLERHGGRLQVESKPGEGSRFTARLPARRAVAA